MIVRIVVVDPAFPDNLLLYQVPEHSRSYTVMVEAFTQVGLEFVEIPSKPRQKKIKEIALP